MGEICIRVQGEWANVHRAVDKHGKTLDFILSRHRYKTAAAKRFACTLGVNGLPRRIVIDRIAANAARVDTNNRMLRSFGCQFPIEMIRIKYLKNMVEQDHRTIKKRVRPMLGFKSHASAASTLESIEVSTMIRKGQLTPGLCPSAQFADLASKTITQRPLANPKAKLATEPPASCPGLTKT